MAAENLIARFESKLDSCSASLDLTLEAPVGEVRELKAEVRNCHRTVSYAGVELGLFLAALRIAARLIR